MTSGRYILIRTLCASYDISPEFMDELYDHGLIQYHMEDNEAFFPEEKLSDLERMIRLHNDLGINMAGIDVIINLMDRMSGLQKELEEVRNRLYLLGDEK